MVIAAALDADEYVPHFCYHPRMSPVGMCRQCMVEVEGPRGPMMVVSCMTPVADGQVVRTDTPQVKRAQEGMLELLLANHPLDCPVCDKGGECPLQDQAFSHGPGESRYVEEKRHYEKPIPISDLVYLDRERCILCDRCTRFADEVAGDKLIHFISRGNDTQVMTFPDEPFVSYFSGNTVQICPVGALTAKPYRFKARPWDLAQRESTCTTCSVGCRTVVQSSRDELLRYQGVDSDPVNWGWLCDRGRFNFEAVNSDHRLAGPLVKTDTGLVLDQLERGASLGGLAGHRRAGRRRPGQHRPARRRTRLERGRVRLGAARRLDRDHPSRRTARRRSARRDPRPRPGDDRRRGQRGHRHPARPRPQRRAAGALPAPARRRREEAHPHHRVLHASTPGCRRTHGSRFVTNPVRSRRRSPRRSPTPPSPNSSPAATSSWWPVARTSPSRPMPPSPHCRRCSTAVPAPEYCRRCGAATWSGALSLGLAPADADHDGMATLRAAADGKLELLVLLGADPLNDCPDADLARRAIAGARRVLAIDTFPCESTQHADVVLAASAYGEKAGTTTNLEGRVTTLAQQVTATGTSRPDWMIAVELGLMIGEHSFGADHPLRGVSTVDDVTALIASTVAGVRCGHPDSARRPSPTACSSPRHRRRFPRCLSPRRVGTAMTIGWW